IRPLHVALAHEELDALVITHAGGVQFETDEIATQARERRRELCEPQLWIVAAVAFVKHHLLAVVRPAFDEAVCAERAAPARRGARQCQTLLVVSGIAFANR